MACTKDVEVVRKKFEEWFNLSFAESHDIYRWLKEIQIHRFTHTKGRD